MTCLQFMDSDNWVLKNLQADDRAQPVLTIFDKIPPILYIL